MGICLSRKNYEHVSQRHNHNTYIRRPSWAARVQGDNFVAILNHLGQDGWEALGVEQPPSQRALFQALHRKLFVETTTQHWQLGEDQKNYNGKPDLKRRCSRATNAVVDHSR